MLKRLPQKRYGMTTHLEMLGGVLWTFALYAMGYGKITKL
jgi:hypothetical protein